MQQYRTEGIVASTALKRSEARELCMSTREVLLSSSSSSSSSTPPLQQTSLTWHTFDVGGGHQRHIAVAKPTNSGTTSLPLTVWLPGGGLFRVSFFFVKWAIPKLAARGHIVIAPCYGTSTPPVLVCTRVWLVVSLLTLVLRLIPGAWPGLYEAMVLAALAAVAVLAVITTKPSVRFPQHIQEAARGVQWALDHGSELGADTSRLVLAGHSAGGQLVTLMMLQPRWLEEVGVGIERVRGVVLLSPVLDWTFLGTASVSALARRLLYEVFLRAQYGVSYNCDYEAQLAAVSPLALARAGATHPDVPVLLLRAGREVPGFNEMAYRIMDLDGYERELRKQQLTWLVNDHVHDGSHVTAQVHLGRTCFELSHPFWKAVLARE